MIGERKLIILFLLINICIAIDYKPDEGVLELNPATFDAAIADNKFILIEFYTPWCQYCQRVRPGKLNFKIYTNEKNFII
jgi:thiol-disulfide isomerase/thioredoxin